MTAQEVRNIGYLAWRDPFAWMETMKGKRWATLLAHEKHNYSKLAKQVHSKAKQMEQELHDVYQYLELPPITIANGTVNIQLLERGKIAWSWAWQTKKTIVDDLDVLGNHVWYAVEDEEHPNKNKIVCVDAKGHVKWTRKEVSDQIAVVGDICYYIMVTNYYNAIELRACHAITGKNEHLLYKEPDDERDLTLWKTANRTLYLQSSDPSKSTLFRVHGLTVTPLYKSSQFQIPIGQGKGKDAFADQGKDQGKGKDQSKGQDDCVLTRQSIDSPWIPRGKPVNEWILPKEEIEYVALNSGHILTISEGARTIWFCVPHKKPTRVFTIKAGEIRPLEWSTWENTDPPMESYIVRSPFSIPQIIHIIDNKVMIDKHQLSIKRPLRFKSLDLYRFHTKSADGTSVPYDIIMEKGVKPKGLLVYVYGAYGSSSVIDWPYKLWYPLLQRRWAIAYALVRGGGDNNMQWADSARRDHRHRSIEDYEAVIRDAQRITKCNARHTVIYGRSAGGVPVGAVVARHPDGALVGAAYTEVPYVDVLRTTTNPNLPLTVGEYKEFGNPRESILNMKELLKVSPVNTLPADGAPGVFVLSRVGLLDRQVYAYESFKWIQKLRGNYDTDGIDPKGKYVIFDMGEAHTYSEKRFIPTHASDLAILDDWMEEKLSI
jgi:protease II